MLALLLLILNDFYNPHGDVTAQHVDGRTDNVTW